MKFRVQADYFYLYPPRGFDEGSNLARASLRLGF
jgi:hypothetical protein